MSPPRYTSIIWDQGGQTYSIQIDATLSESHVFQNTVTDHPIEGGAAITDHSRPNPVRLGLTGMISNHPLVLPLDHIGNEITESTRNVDVVVIPVVSATAPFRAPDPRQDIAVSANITPGYSATAKVVEFTDTFDRARAVFDSLVAVRDAGTLVRVVTGLREYTSMVIESLTVPVDAGTGEALIFDIGFKQVILAVTQNVAIKKAKGHKQSKHITVPEHKEAGDNVVLGRVVDFFTGAN
jgi:hypothetical protein